MSPRPQHDMSQPQQLGLMRFSEELDCTCKDCLKFAAFVEDHTARSVHFSFGTESRIAHYKTYQLHQITKGGFQHTCTITPAENNDVGSYSVTVRKTKTQFAMGEQKGQRSPDQPETPAVLTPTARASAPKYTTSAPKTKAPTLMTRSPTPKKRKRKRKRGSK